MLAFCLLAHSNGTARAATNAWGTINNFDCVNDNGVECHGFEIEIEDCHSRDITYTYNWNHYGTPSITEDNSNPLHPKTIVRYASAKNPDGTWAAYTAVPSGPILPTDGHQFTNPSTNFGGEHFGVGCTVASTNISYHWLVDNGAGVLVRGTAVMVSTPTFTYFPPGRGRARAGAGRHPAAAPAGSARAGIRRGFLGEGNPHHHPQQQRGASCATWCPMIRTIRMTPTGATANRMRWKWNGSSCKPTSTRPTAAPTANWRARRKTCPAATKSSPAATSSTGMSVPLDNETGEAMADRVGPDGIHGVGIKTINGVEVDLSTVEVVGEFVGSQMAAFDAEVSVGLIDHVQDGVQG